MEEGNFCEISTFEGDFRMMGENFVDGEIFVILLKVIIGGIRWILTFRNVNLVKSDFYMVIVVK